MDDLYYEFECGCRIKQCGTYIKENDGLPPLNIDFYNLPNCNKTWELIGTGKTKGVFQLESNLGQNWANKTEPFNLSELAALTAVIRPACLDSFIDKKSLTEHYADRKTGRSEVESLHPVLDDILKETQQIILYQEDAIRIAREVAGFSLVRSDTLRQAIGKKLVDKMQSLKTEFIDGCINTSGLSKKDAEEIFSIIENSASYSFNKCLCPETLVEKQNSELKTIDEIEIGDFILAPGKEKDIYVEVIDKIESGEKDVVEITLESGKNIICTLEHKFLTETGEVLPLYKIISLGLKIICEDD